jgi:hypothetical protein
VDGRPVPGATILPVSEHALKEWAVTCEALARGSQVLILRKGGIGEKRFELPHRRFFLFPTYAHQRPELVKAEHRGDFAGPLARREEPDVVALTPYAELHAAHTIRDPEALEALGPLHILSADYAAERLRWRRTQPLWAAVLRVYRPAEPPRLRVLPERGGCVSWVALPDDVAPGALAPALDDERFAASAAAVEEALAGVRAG